MTIFQIITLVIQVVALIEKLFGEASGQGTIKKSTATSVITALMGGAEQVMTGGAKETIQALQPQVGNIIDVAVGLANSLGWDKIQNDVVDTTLPARG